MATDDSNDSGIDISPLIDCVFILLIFFIVTTTFIEEAGIEVDKPQPAAASDLDKESIVITLTDSGDVLHEGGKIGLGGVRPMVENKLRQEDVPVIIQADINAESGMLVRVIDEAKLAGAEKVSLASHRGGK
jgi:biopolymer transport protein ExbD